MPHSPEHLSLFCHRGISDAVGNDVNHFIDKPIKHRDYMSFRDKKLDPIRWWVPKEPKIISPYNEYNGESLSSSVVNSQIVGKYGNHTHNIVKRNPEEAHNDLLFIKGFRESSFAEAYFIHYMHDEYCLKKNRPDNPSHVFLMNNSQLFIDNLFESVSREYDFDIAFLNAKEFFLNSNPYC